MSNSTKVVGKLRAYFLQGHMRFFTIIVRLVVDSTIVYALLFDQFPVLYDFFPHYLVFFCIFVPVYIGACIAVGYYDFSRKIYHGEGSLFFKPIYDHIDKKFEELT
jgi:hypothetical protein